MSMLDNYLGNPTYGSGYGGIANKAMAQYAQPATNSFMSSFNNLLGSNGLKNLANYGTAGYGMYLNNQQLGLQKDAFDFNKMLSNTELERRRKADKSLQTAYNNSTYAQGV